MSLAALTLNVDAHNAKGGNLVPFSFRFARNDVVIRHVHFNLFVGTSKTNANKIM